MICVIRRPRTHVDADRLAVMLPGRGGRGSAQRGAKVVEEHDLTCVVVGVDEPADVVGKTQQLDDLAARVRGRRTRLFAQRHGEIQKRIDDERIVACDAPSDQIAEVVDEVWPAAFLGRRLEQGDSAVVAATADQTMVAAEVGSGSREQLLAEDGGKLEFQTTVLVGGARFSA